MFCSEPVSKLSTHTTRWPRAISASHRCEPRKPAPPVTRQVAIGGTVSGRAVRFSTDRSGKSLSERGRTHAQLSVNRGGKRTLKNVLPAAGGDLRGCFSGVRRASFSPRCVGVHLVFSARDS